MNPILQKLAGIHPAYGEAVLCRLGQHSFLVKLGETLLAIDPYLSSSPKRLIAPPVPAEDFAGVDIILTTHDHADHIDRESLPAVAAASPQALLGVPEAVRGSITEFPAERLTGFDEFKPQEFRGIRITAVAAAHEFLDRTADGHYPYLGFVISGNGVTLYHSGDCCIYDGLAAKLAPFGIDVMLLPINGRDAERYTHNIIGNMTYQEAADLAGWLKIPLTVPAHYDMFACNLENPELFTAYMRAKYPALQSRILDPGEIFTFRKGC